jgi:hypothetical protein
MEERTDAQFLETSYGYSNGRSGSIVDKMEIRWKRGGSGAQLKTGTIPPLCNPVPYPAVRLLSLAIIIFLGGQAVANGTL